MGLRKAFKSVVKSVVSSSIAKVLLPAVAGPLGVALSVAGTALAVRDVVRAIRPNSGALAAAVAATPVAKSIASVQEVNLFSRQPIGGTNVSLLGGISQAVRQIGRKARSAAGFPVSAGGLASIGAVGAAAAGAVTGVVRRNLPGIAGGVAGGVATGLLFDEMGNPVGQRRRRGRGFSSRDIRQTRRMLRLIGDMARLCPRPRRAGGHHHHK